MQVPPKLLIFLLIIGLIEIYLFYLIGGMIGLEITIGIIIATAILGVVLVRSQRGNAMQNALMSAMQSGEGFSGAKIFGGILLMIAGVLLFIPGFLTDTLGLILLTPPVRSFIGGKIAGSIMGQLGNMSSMQGMEGMEGMEQMMANLQGMGQEDDEDEVEDSGKSAAKSKRKPGKVVDAEIIDDDK